MSPWKEFDIKHAAVKIPKSDGSSTPSDPDINYILYSWLVENLNLYDPIHQLGLYIAVLFSRIPPYVSFPQSNKKGFILTNPKSQPALNEDIRAAPWIAPRNEDTSGKLDGLPYIILFLGYFLGLWDPSSPLCPLLSASNSCTLHTAFHNKHHKKGITPFNPIHIGVAEALTPKAAKGAQFTVDWKFCSEQDLLELHDNLQLCFLADAPFRVYNTVVELFSTDCVEALCRLAVEEENQCLAHSSCYSTLCCWCYWGAMWPQCSWSTSFPPAAGFHTSKPGISTRGSRARNDNSGSEVQPTSPWAITDLRCL